MVTDEQDSGGGKGAAALMVGDRIARGALPLAVGGGFGAAFWGLPAGLTTGLLRREGSAGGFELDGESGVADPGEPSAGLGRLFTITLTPS